MRSSTSTDHGTDSICTTGAKVVVGTEVATGATGGAHTAQPGHTLSRGVVRHAPDTASTPSAKATRCNLMRRPSTVGSATVGPPTNPQGRCRPVAEGSGAAPGRPAY